MMRRAAVWFSIALLLLLPAVALAWTQQSPFNSSVHGHEFRKVVLENTDCMFRYKLYFGAPGERYPEGKGPQVYRFRARIKLLSGQSVISPVFHNRAAGERMYTGMADTSAEGCWAKEQQKPIGVSVEGCRGKSCTPDPFD
jgi:hypothetical protein